MRSPIQKIDVISNFKVPRNVIHLEGMTIRRLYIYEFILKQYFSNDKRDLTTKIIMENTSIKHKDKLLKELKYLEIQKLVKKISEDENVYFILYYGE